MCNISINSGRQYSPGPLRYKPAAISENWYDKADITVYVDAKKGNDSNPGTAALPVKTIPTALRLYRLQKQSLTQQGVIFLSAGTYHLNETVDLEPGDSNLVISGENANDVVVSGGREYNFGWEEIVNTVTSLQFTSSINITAIPPGASNNHARFAGKMANFSECPKACESDTSCFAFTWFNNSGGNFTKY